MRIFSYLIRSSSTVPSGGATVKGVLSAGRACRAVARGPVRSAHAPVRTEPDDY